MSLDPILSIITVVFNNENYIGKAIENFLSQNCEVAELLIVDGASTDNTLLIIKKYASEYPTIRWISEKDSGQSDAMNKSLKLAKGKYISFLNVDDYYSNGVLNEVVSIISKDGAPSFIVGNCHVWDEKEHLVYVNKPRKLKTWHILSGFYLPVNPTAYFYRKDLHEKIGNFNEENHHNMDIEFLIEASLVTEMKYYPKDWGNFRLLPNTKTVNDQEDGSLHYRKKELFKSFLDRLPIKIKFFTQCVIYYETLKRKIFLTFKIIKTPFEMVYWKMNKLFVSK
jgi:glycosyltransferase involved in cell wall biosynthesis